MKRLKTGLTLAAGIMVLAATAFAAPSSPEMLALSCAGCHGAWGASAGPTIPSLAGQPKAAIVDAMKRFKSDERVSSVMGRLAKGYSDAEFEAMADYFSRQQPPVIRQAVDAARAAKGATLHETHCAECHRDNGKTGIGNTPRLAGQWLRYLQMQMDLVAAGKRKMPAEMAKKVEPLSREDLDALLHFYAGVVQ